MRIFAGQQANQQLVKVVARQQCISRWHDMTAHPLGAFKRTDFCVATEGQRQWLQGQQYRAKTGGGPLRPFGYQSDAAMVSREYIQNQTGLAPVVMVKDVGGLVGYANRATSGGPGTAGGHVRKLVRFSALTGSRTTAPALRHRPSLSEL